MPKTIAIIPARGGSKGLTKKNIRPLMGRPILAYTIDAARSAGVIDRIFVTTDSEEIAAVAREAGAEVPFLRPADLAQDATTMEDTLQHALLAFEKHSGETFDIGVFLSPTEIFRKPEWIAQAVRTLAERPELESVFMARATYKNFWEPLPMGGYQRVRTYMQVYGQRQERLAAGRVIYREYTGLTCASRAELWRKGRRIGDRVEIIQHSEDAAEVDIHSEFDLFLAEQALRWRRGG